MANLEPGGQFAGYHVISQLGAGGMGQVYLVEHPHLLRREALKIISVAAAGQSDFQQRFTNEARTVAMLNHPGIIGIHHYGIDDGAPWFTMTYLDGTDLDGTLLPDHEIALVSQRTADALDYAHRHQVIHRDVKPANIMVTREADGSLDQVVLLDFGIAKLADSTSLTATSAFVGTLTYSAPEIIDGRPASPASDQYALACSLYKMLTGDAPFQAETTTALMAAVLSKPAAPISTIRPDLAALDPVFERALTKDPAQRFPDCRSFAQALSEALGYPPATSALSLSPTMAHAETRANAPQAAPKAQRRKKMLFGALAALVVAAVALTTVLLLTRSESAPTVPPIADTYTDVAVGEGSTCVIKARELLCWGNNEYGQLGDGTVNARNTPAKVPGLTDVTDVAMSNAAVCAVAAGKAYCWGTLEKIRQPVEVPGLENVTSVATNLGSSCAIANSFLYCWGSNTYGELGDGTTTMRSSPTKVESLVDVTEVSMADDTTCAMAAGVAKCWGLNDSGQLGDGTTTDQSKPTDIVDLKYVKSISTGAGMSRGTTCAIRLDNDVYCWGSNRFNEVGDGTDVTRERPVKVFSGARSVFVADGRSCAITLDRELYCWGERALDQPAAEPTKVPSLKNVTGFAASYGHSCALADGTVYCWGLNDDSELGDGTTEARKNPTKVNF